MQQQSPLELLLLGLKKVLIRPHTKPPIPEYEGNPGILLPTLGSTALESQQAALEAEGLAGRQQEGSGQRPSITWAGQGTVATVRGGESHSLGKGLGVADLIRIGAPLRRGQYSPDKGMTL